MTEEISRLEAELNRSPSREVLNKLLDAYVARRDSKSLNKALSLLLHNLDTFKDQPRFLARAAHLLVLVMDNPAARDLAGDLASRLITLEPDYPHWYVTAGYVYWWTGNVSAAIEVSELGLRRLATAEPTEALLDLKGNLAYYYAERGLKENAEKARSLAMEAYQAAATPSRADSLGYVLMKFPTSQDDLRKARDYFVEAKRRLEKLGLTNPLVEQHLEAVVKDFTGEPGQP